LPEKKLKLIDVSTESKFIVSLRTPDFLGIGSINVLGQQEVFIGSALVSYTLEH
jgi:hypothetical protein